MSTGCSRKPAFAIARRLCATPSTTTSSDAGSQSHDRARRNAATRIPLRHSAGMTVRGLFETHLTVADLPRSVAFYRDVVGLPVALELPERGAAFHWIGRPGQAMLGLWSIGSAPMGMRLHVAFEMALADGRAAPDRLRAEGIQPLSFFRPPTDEPSVIG